MQGIDKDWIKSTSWVYSYQSEELKKLQRNNKMNDPQSLTLYTHDNDLILKFNLKKRG